MYQGLVAGFLLLWILCAPDLIFFNEEKRMSHMLLSRIYTLLLYTLFRLLLTPCNTDNGIIRTKDLKIEVTDSSSHSC